MSYGHSLAGTWRMIRGLIDVEDEDRQAVLSNITSHYRTRQLVRTWKASANAMLYRYCDSSNSRSDTVAARKVGLRVVDNDWLLSVCVWYKSGCTLPYVQFPACELSN